MTSKTKEKEDAKINDLIKGFFKHNNFDNALECFEAEIKTKKFIKQKPKFVISGEPMLNRMVKGESY